MAPTQSKSLSRMAQLALRTIIFISIAFATLWTVLSFWPGLAILPFVGRARSSPFCSTWQAVRDAAGKARQGELEKEIRANTRLIRTENGYKLWSTPKGEFWVPDTSDEIIEVLLAQQKRKIYGDAESGGVRAGEIVRARGNLRQDRPGCRSRESDCDRAVARSAGVPAPQLCPGGPRRSRHHLPERHRSEEHTSELQSLRHLVC